MLKNMKHLPMYLVVFAGLAGLAYVGVFVRLQPNTGNGFELDAIAMLLLAELHWLEERPQLLELL